MAIKDSTLTQKRLKELLHYSPDTGIFVRKVRTSTRVHIGDIAGWICESGGKRYWRVSIENEIYKCHRLAFLYMTGAWPEDQVDHVDGNGLNNRWDNLRQATCAENSKNQRLYKNNTSGYVGISWHKQSEKWHVRIANDGKLLHLGLFADIEKAIEIRKEAEIKYDYHINHGQDRPS